MIVPENYTPKGARCYSERLELASHCDLYTFPTWETTRSAKMRRGTTWRILTCIPKGQLQIAGETSTPPRRPAGERNQNEPQRHIHPSIKGRNGGPLAGVLVLTTLGAQAVGFGLVSWGINRKTVEKLHAQLVTYLQATGARVPGGGTPIHWEQAGRGTSTDQRGWTD